MNTINNILKLEDEVAIIEAIGSLIWEKKEATEDFSALTDEEKVFVFIDIFEGAMGEGGLHFFFTSESGNFVEEIITSYQEIKAPKTAELIANAVKIFPKTYTVDLEERQALIAKAEEEILSGWEDLDELFFTNESEEDVVTLIVDYIKANESQFGR
ncbi:DMP19 family protein [Flavobacterium sp. N2820]|mgnify:FL=1|jgi:hypothetical protein|uniref:DMP19 family protein n=1 Tax=Flavobacterium sp. N2820 TaxID=2986834 RepID=UPI0022254CEA|nr:DMP19 family protein [Flavobacterium sp. N2820]